VEYIGIAVIGFVGALFWGAGLVGAAIWGVAVSALCASIN
jgi:cellobiose-specific phosphotransferase system component IIC